jgi:hypothetical protein
MSPALEAAANAGIDLSLIELSLSYSYDKRAEQHQAALELALELERVGRQLRGATEPSDCVSATRISASVEIELFGRRCRVTSVEDLIAAKQSMGRDKDLIAVKELKAIIASSGSN